MMPPSTGCSGGVFFAGDYVPVKIHPTTWLVSNKPQEPKPLPPETLFPSKLEMHDGRVVWVSQPQPDRLAIIGDIGSDTLSSAVPADSNPLAVVKAIGDYLLDNPFNAHQVDFWWDPVKGYHRKITLGMGARGSHVRFEPVPPKAGKGWRLRIEMNPRKLGHSGVDQLRKVLGSGNAPFKLSEFVKTCRITRLDVAIDLVGIRVSEVLLGHKKEGKRSCYIGVDGALETIMLHRKKPPVKPKTDQFGDPKKLFHSAQPAGAVIIKAYDRVRERAALLKPAPFGPAPVTRIEITLQRLGKEAALKNLTALSNPFKASTVALTPAQPQATDPVWWQYVSLRRTSGPLSAETILGLSPMKAKAYEASLSKPCALNTPELWKSWEPALGNVGFGAFLSVTSE